MPISQPTFLLKDITLPMEIPVDPTQSPVSVGYALEEHYVAHLFPALIKSCGGKVQFINIPQTKQSARGSGGDFVTYTQDPVVILEDKKLILYPSSGSDIFQTEMQVKAILMRDSLTLDTGYHFIPVSGAYFEGGNLFYDAKRSLLLHGMNPDGHYPRRPSIEDTNTLLREALKSKGIDMEILPVSLNTELQNISTDCHYKRESREEKLQQAFADYYYHLDCCMQLLPNGKLIVLNMELFSAESQANLRDKFGDDLIDLHYEDYIDTPFMLNFISIPQEDESINIIAPSMPDVIRQRLEENRLHVYTPESMNCSSPHFDLHMTERVVAEMRETGFEDIAQDNIFSHVPCFSHDYRCEDGTSRPATIFDSAKGAYFKPLDKYFTEKCEDNQGITFTTGHGGPHCLALQIKTELVSSELHEVKDSQVSIVKDTIKPAEKRKSIRPWDMRLFSSSMQAACNKGLRSELS